MFKNSKCRKPLLQDSKTWKRSKTQKTFNKSCKTGKHFKTRKPLFKDSNNLVNNVFPGNLVTLYVVTYTAFLKILKFLP